jgi:hypothetical protein
LQIIPSACGPGFASPLRHNKNRKWLTIWPLFPNRAAPRFALPPKHEERSVSTQMRGVAQNKTKKLKIIVTPSPIVTPANPLGPVHGSLVDRELSRARYTRNLGAAITSHI